MGFNILVISVPMFIDMIDKLGKLSFDIYLHHYNYWHYAKPPVRHDLDTMRQRQNGRQFCRQHFQTDFLEWKLYFN